MGKHRNISAFFLLFNLTFLWGAGAQAATFNIAAGDAQGFQDALDDSEANGEDDIINLAAGTYSTGDLTIPAAFTFQSTESNSITITGAGMGSTFLDGGGMGGTPVMILEVDAFGGEMLIQDLTIQNGESAFFGGGLDIRSLGTNVNLVSCEFKNNDATFAGGGLFVDILNASLSLMDNRFIENKGTAAGGLRINSLNVNILLSNNLFEMNQAETDSGGAAIEVEGGVLHMDGNTFKKNIADSDDDMIGNSGGLSIKMEEGSATLENNTFEENQAFAAGGASVEAQNANVTIQNNTVLKNTAEVSAAGIGVVFQSGSLHFRDNKIQENQAGTIVGGLGLVAMGAEIIVENNLLEKNKADIIGVAGGSIVMQAGTLQFNGNNLMGNLAGINVGGIGIQTQEVDVTFHGNTFMGNSSGNDESTGGDFGAAQLEVTEGFLNFDSNTFLDNHALNGPMSEVGGIKIFTEGSSIIFTNNIFAGNSAEGDAGGAWLETSGSRIDVVNNTIIRNTSGEDVGGLLVVLSPDVDSSANIYNNILLGNAASTMTLANLALDDENGSGDGNPVNIFNNDLPSFFSQCRNTGGCTPRIAEGNNKNEDPMFVDASMDDFRLLGSSGLIDMGTADAPSLPEFDHDGNPRIFGPAPDIGALEAVPMLAVSAESLDFGNVAITTNATQGLTIMNEGTFDLAISDLILSDSTNYSLNPNGGADPCGSTSFTLAFGESCTVEITFGPTAEGRLDATVTINSDDPTVASLVVALLGVGTLFTPIGGGGGGCTCGLHPAMNSGLSYGIYFLLVPVGWWWLRRKAKQSL